MSHIWNEKELLELINGIDEYADVFDSGDFEYLREIMAHDGYEVSKNFLYGEIIDLGIDINDGITRAGEMKYTIVGTQGDKRNYNHKIYNATSGHYDKEINSKKYIYRYAGLNNKKEPVALTMGERRTYMSRVYFKDYPSAETFFNNFIEHPNIKNRESQVNWKIIPISKRNPLGDVRSKGIEMKNVNSAVGFCYQID